MGQHWQEVYRTGDEIKCLRELFDFNRVRFLQQAELIMSGKRAFGGDGMRVDVWKVKLFLKDKIAQHEAELAQGITPPNQTGRRTS